MSRQEPEIVRWARELFAGLGTIRVKSMFGGWGFYCDDRFFALVVDETLYLKASDEAAQAQFAAAGSQPFRYRYPDGREMTMGYWSAPDEALDSPAAMMPWARLAFACALKAGARKSATAKKPRRA